MTVEGVPMVVVAEAPVFELASGETAVVVCNRCGQPLASLGEVCRSGLHTGTDGSGEGHGVLSTDLVRAHALTPRGPREFRA